MHRGIIGAANQNRTDDLILTKDVLYQLSHSSISQIDEHYYIRKLVVCQVFFELFLKTVNISARTWGSSWREVNCGATIDKLFSV